MTHLELISPISGNEKWEKLGTRQSGWTKVASGRTYSSSASLWSAGDPSVRRWITWGICFSNKQLALKTQRKCYNRVHKSHIWKLDGYWGGDDLGLRSSPPLAIVSRKTFILTWMVHYNKLVSWWVEKSWDSNPNNLYSRCMKEAPESLELPRILFKVCQWCQRFACENGTSPRQIPWLRGSEGLLKGN
jgi:hypothetical protein